MKVPFITLHVFADGAEKAFLSFVCPLNLLCSSVAEVISLSNSSDETIFFTFNADNYTLNLPFQSSSETSMVKVQFDNSVRSVIIDKSLCEFVDVEIGPVKIGEGYHNITIETETCDPLFTLGTIAPRMGIAELGFRHFTSGDFSVAA